MYQAKYLRYRLRVEYTRSDSILTSTNSAQNTASVVQIESARAYVGTARAFISKDGESPLRRQQLGTYWIDATSVTNERFEQFVIDTGYVTEAEEIGWSFAFLSHIPSPEHYEQLSLIHI